MNLYELTQEAKLLASILESEELSEDLEMMLVINQNDLQAKSINYAKVISNFESDANAIEGEIKRLKAMKDSKDKSIHRLKEAVRVAMIESHIEKIESPLFKLSLRRSEAVEVDEVGFLPSEFIVEKTTLSADKVAIKKAIKDGQNVTGARIIENFNLNIK
jgi:esterase/lipase